MTPYFEADGVTLYHGDALAVLGELPDASVEAVITDPPAGISFMGRAWDHHRGGREQWSGWLAEVMAECLRVAKPGAHAVVWALPRTSHWTACGLEDAGWEIRDRITHLFASGFPKSLAVDKAIDKAAGAEREVVGRKGGRNAYLRTDIRGGNYIGGSDGTYDGADITAPATDEARRWSGFGTALKPAAEDWWLCRKPFPGSVASNVLAYGTGALNIDGCRVAGETRTYRARGMKSLVDQHATHDRPYVAGLPNRDEPLVEATGRWPSNVVLSHTATPDEEDLCVDGCVPGCPVLELDRQSGVLTSGMLAPHHDAKPSTNGSMRGGNYAGRIKGTFGGDSGGASRFFPVFRYEPKAPTHERPRVKRSDGTTEAHATVKPLDLMRWLVRLITPPGGIVLDPFLGSGTTAEACVIEGFRCIGVEREPCGQCKSGCPDYLSLVVKRLSKPIQPVLEVPCA